MKIVNVMISKVMGGIEQAFLSYNAAFETLGYEVLSVIDNKSAVADKVKTSTLKIKFQKLNPLLVFKLYFALKKFAPDVIIVHQKKAIPLMRIVARLVGAKLVGVAHNPKIKRLEKCDAVLSVTQNQADKMRVNGLNNVPIFVVPNMIEMPQNEPEYQPLRTPVVIGTMGRFEPIKGFCDLLKALAILKQHGVLFKAVIGGGNNGTYDDEERRIFQTAEELNLQNEVDFCGWVNDKSAFFEKIDIFVLPSLEESFGMVLLEAAFAKKPLICSDADGPKEVWGNTDAALVFERGNAEMLADKLAKMLAHPATARDMAEKAYRRVDDNYAIRAVAKVLQSALEKVTEEK